MNPSLSRSTLASTLAAVLLGLATAAQAATVQVTVSVENLAPAGGIAFAPLHVGFHQGVFDGFDEGAAAAAGIVSVAENGSGSAWQPAFAAADPMATRGTVGGVLLAGGMASQTFLVDTALNPFFTFAAMVVPSNDFFIGNDGATQYPLFDAAGHLLIAEIMQSAADIWDAGSEAFDPAAAAFVGDASGHTDQNGVVNRNFAELAQFDGLTTAAGYTFASQLQSGTPIYRIRFDAQTVPAPATAWLAVCGLAGLGATRRRRAG